MPGREGQDWGRARTIARPIPQTASQFFPITLLRPPFHIVTAMIRPTRDLFTGLPEAESVEDFEELLPSANRRSHTWPSLTAPPGKEAHQ
jgi:hypothetical protein